MQSARGREEDEDEEEEDEDEEDEEDEEEERARSKWNASPARVVACDPSLFSSSIGHHIARLLDYSQISRAVKSRVRRPVMRVYEHQLGTEDGLVVMFKYHSLPCATRYSPSEYVPLPPAWFPRPPSNFVELLSSTSTSAL